jgi:VIT1/CCC1 family predicted Fe2+/Mn2+ transporter
VVFVLLFVVAIRVTVNEMFRGIASSRATGLAAMGWDTSQMWSTIGKSVAFSARSGAPWIARSADLRTHSSTFDRSVEQLHRITESRHGYFEDLRTESRSGSGRALAATVAVPAQEFDAALADLQSIGRVESITQAGEDAAVKIATAARKLSAAQTNVARLQKLQRERRGELRDAVALEKDIAQANEEVAGAEREHESLLSTVAQAYIQVTLLEDYRAPLELSLAGALLQVRNSFVDGISAILSTLAAFFSILLGYGLPVAFWLCLLFVPLRFFYRWLRGRKAYLAPAS